MPISDRSARLLAQHSPVDLERLQRAEAAVRSKYPKIGALKFKVQPGQGPGYAEFYPADEAYNPNPGTPTLEVRKFALSDKELESVILGDALHLAGSEIEGFRKGKQEFVKSLKPSQLGVLRDMYEDDRQSGSKRTFGEFVEQSGADAFIRDYMFQSENAIPGGKPFVEGVGPVLGAFFEDQIPVLENMRRSLR